MILFGTPNGVIDNDDRAMWLTPPFNYGFGIVTRPPWEHPVKAKATNAIQISASNARITASAAMPRIELDGDTDIDPPAENERIEVGG